ncbi:hypothetical protein [Roseovarius sp.]|jgi:uncharacterized phage infection (PIP) family protein YhgE
MTNTPPDLDSGIRLAIEAAEAATDSVAELDAVQSDITRAADRLDATGRRMTPILLGMLAGTAVSVVGAGLVYFNTLGRLDTAYNTQIEALAMFADRVEALDTHIAAAAALSDRLTQLDQTLLAQIGALDSRISELQQGLTTELSGMSASVSGACTQIGSTLIDTVTDAHDVTRADSLKAASDLQLALSRMLAEAPPLPAAAKPATPAPQPSRPKAVRSPSRPVPNPFSYP